MILLWMMQLDAVCADMWWRRSRLPTSRCLDSILLADMMIWYDDVAERCPCNATAMSRCDEAMSDEFFDVFRELPLIIQHTVALNLTYIQTMMGAIFNFSAGYLCNSMRWGSYIIHLNRKGRITSLSIRSSITQTTTSCHQQHSNPSAVGSDTISSTPKHSNPIKGSPA